MLAHEIAVPQHFNFGWSDLHRGTRGRKTLVLKIGFHIGFSEDVARWKVIRVGRTASCRDARLMSVIPRERAVLPVWN